MQIIWGNSGETKVDVDTVESGELLFLQNTDNFPFSVGTIIDTIDELRNYINQIIIHKH